MFRPMVTVPFQPTIPLPVTVVMPSVALTTAVAPTSPVTTSGTPPRFTRLTYFGSESTGASGGTVSLIRLTVLELVLPAVFVSAAVAVRRPSARRDRASVTESVPGASSAPAASCQGRPSNTVRDGDAPACPGMAKTAGPGVTRFADAGADTPGAPGATVFFTNVVATGREPSVGVMVTASTASDSPERSRTAGSMPSPPTVPDPVIALTPSETL